MNSHPREETDALYCDQCGCRYRIGEKGIANHINDQAPDGIDHDSDDDHVPYGGDAGLREGIDGLGAESSVAKTSMPASDVCDSIRRLVEEQTIDSALYDRVVAIAGEMRRHASDSGQKKFLASSIEDQAGDFMVAVARQELSGTLKTLSDLNREFRRWLTRRNNPEGTELWSVISETLLKLEKSGTVQRAEGFRRFNNSNQTPWYLPVHEGKARDFSLRDQVKTRMPRLGAKGEDDRVLKPTEARASVMAVLETFASPVAMGELVAVIAECLPLMRVNESIDKPIGSDGDTTTFGDSLEADPVLQNYQMIIDEECEHATSHIWAEAAALCRRSQSKIIDGCRILCCYLLPKDMYGEKVTLSDFGPTSTVQQIVGDLRAVLTRWLPMGESKSCQQWLSRETTRAILAAIVNRCTENGLCKAFYESRQ